MCFNNHSPHILYLIFTNIYALEIYTYKFSLAVAVIGMEVPDLTVSENATSPKVTVCVELINLIELAIPLTASIKTLSGTATG